MEIKSVNNLNFSSRNPQIRTLDNIMRKTHNLYPSCSTSRLVSFNTMQNNNYAQGKLVNLATKLSFLVRYELADIREKSPHDYFQKVLELLQKHRLANCLEHTDLSATVLGMNNIPVSRAKIYVKNCIPCGEVYDHILSIIPLKKDALISQDFNNTPLHKLKDILIYDSYCGFVDFPAKAVERYKGELKDSVSSQIARKMKKDSYFTERMDKDIYLNFDVPQVPVMDKEIAELLKKSHPELVFKS